MTDEAVRDQYGRALMFAQARSDPLARLPALAARLGVAPLKDDKTPSVMLVTEAGERYDLFDLVNALLDRMDA